MLRIEMRTYHDRCECKVSNSRTVYLAPYFIPFNGSGSIDRYTVTDESNALDQRHKTRKIQKPTMLHYSS